MTVAILNCVRVTVRTKIQFNLEFEHFFRACLISMGTSSGRLWLLHSRRESCCGIFEADTIVADAELCFKTLQRPKDGFATIKTAWTIFRSTFILWLVPLVVNRTFAVFTWQLQKNHFTGRSQQLWLIILLCSLWMKSSGLTSLWYWVTSIKWISPLDLSRLTEQAQILKYVQVIPLGGSQNVYNLSCLRLWIVRVLD